MAALHPELVRQNVEHTELLGPLSKKQQYNNYLNNISFYNKEGRAALTNIREMQ